MMLSDPPMLILDEAKSLLNAESERVVQQALARADSVVVLDEGCVLEIGRHEELFERCDLYRRLCDLQFIRPADTATE